MPPVKFSCAKLNALAVYQKLANWHLTKQVHVYDKTRPVSPRRSEQQVQVESKMRTGRSPGIRPTMFLIITCICLFQLVAANTPPSFDPIPDSDPQQYYDMDKERYREDAIVGSYLYTLKASDPDGDPITFSVNEDDHFDLYNQTDTEATVYLKKALDYETATRHDITWFLDDSVNSAVRTGVSIYVTDVNDNAPVFDRPSYTEDVHENETIGTTLLTVSASDADSGTNGEFTFSITNEAALDGMFYLETDTSNSEQAHLILNDTLDYETKIIYQVQIMAQDHGTDPESLSSTTTVFINVLDVQDTPPFFINLPYFGDIDENMPVNTSVMLVYALDGDRGVPQSVEFFIYDDTSFWVDNIIGNEGIIRSSVVLDRESLEIAIITFTLTAKEKDDCCNQPLQDITTNTTVSIAVNDINDEPPTFDQTSYTGTVQENSPKDVAVDGINMQVSDLDTGDGGRFALTVIGDEESTHSFYVTPETAIRTALAIIRVKNNTYLDYETRKQFNFQVLAYETHTAEYFNSTTNVTVNLIDMNDNSPVFDQNPYNSTIDEHSPVGTFVVLLNATDADSGTFGEVTYKLQGGAANLFQVDSVTGNVTVLDSKGLDRETTLDDMYMVIASANDGGDRTSTSQIDVYINDINDHPPEFLRDEYEGFIKENLVKAEIVQVEARDLDINENGEIEYSIISVSPAEGAFVINSTSGWVGVSSGLDFEALPDEMDGKYTLIVKAEDRGEPRLHDNTTVSINVEGINDNAPYFLQKIYTANITEEFKEQDYVITVHAFDDDVYHEPYQYDSTVDYRIISGSNDKFSLSPTTGYYNTTDTSHSNISISLGVVNMDVDEYGHTYVMTLRATDRGNPPLEDECTLYVYVEDINNKPPQFVVKSVVERVSEDETMGYSITTMHAEDPDMDNELVYEITAIQAENERGEPVTDNDFTYQFYIDPSNGTVYVNESLNREEVEIYYLDIMVTDINAAADYPDQTDEASLEVRIDDVNDNEPEFQNTQTGLNGIEYYDGSIQEENPDAIYSEVKAVDPDKGTNGDVEYFIIDNSTHHFKINKDTGTITLNEAIDREEYDELNITVRAQDKGVPPLHTDVLVYFVITDINDNDPEFINLPNDTSILENATVNSEVFTAYATDADIGNHAVITYSITAGNIDDVFDIREETGVIFVKGVLDRETIEIYDLTITATDNPGGSPRLQSSEILKVTLIDVNDNPPEFFQSEYKSEVREDEIVGTIVTRVTADDPDLGDGGIVDYSFGDRNDTNLEGDYLFEIDTDDTTNINTGVVKVQESLQNQHGFYFLELIATDRGTPQLSSNASLYIRVIDVNDNPPVFIYVELSNGTIIYLDGSTSVNVHVTEDYHGHVCTVFADDYDTGPNGEVSYSFREDVDPSESFQYFDLGDISGVINTTDGHVTDRETIADYPLFVLATDNGEPNQFSTELSVMVIVDDIDDNPPTFQRDEDGMPIPDILEPIEEKDYGGQSIGKVTEADDLDIGENAVNYYFIVAGNELERFTLNNFTREIFATEVLDREDIAQYDLTVKADPDENWSAGVLTRQNTNVSIEDPTYWNDTSLQHVIIDVVDINDNPPIFKKKYYTAGVATDAEYESSVTRVEAIDADEGINAVVIYNITKQICDIDQSNPDCGEAFKFRDPYDGIVYTNLVFEPDWTGYFDLKIVAYDIDYHNDTAYLSIYLLRDDQRVKIIVLAPVDEVLTWIDDFMDDIEEITGAQCNADSVKVHIVPSTNEPDNSKTDIFIHCVDPETNEIMDVYDIIDLLDRYEENLEEVFKKYSVIAVVPAVTDEVQLDYSQYLQITMGALLFVLLFLLILLFCCYFSMRSKYKRKLRAARAGTFGSQDSGLNREANVPGTNKFKFEGSNPVWNSDFNVYNDPQEQDNNSLDENVVEAETEHSEDQEITIDFNDDYEYYSKLPPDYMESDDILSAAIGEHEQSKKEKFGLDLEEMDVTAV
ncbi:cadherin-23-like [Glandiceps talaboti]